jgi:hypothetical protein
VTEEAGDVCGLYDLARRARRFARPCRIEHRAASPCPYDVSRRTAAHNRIGEPRNRRVARRPCFGELSQSRS